MQHRLLLSFLLSTLFVWVLPTTFQVFLMTYILYNSELVVLTDLQRDLEQLPLENMVKNLTQYLSQHVSQYLRHRSLVDG